MLLKEKDISKNSCYKNYFKNYNKMNYNLESSDISFNKLKIYDYFPSLKVAKNFKAMNEQKVLKSIYTECFRYNDCLSLPALSNIEDILIVADYLRENFNPSLDLEEDISNNDFDITSSLFNFQIKSFKKNNELNLRRDINALLNEYLIIMLIKRNNQLNILELENILERLESIYFHEYFFISFCNLIYQKFQTLFLTIITSLVKMFKDLFASSINHVKIFLYYFIKPLIDKFENCLKYIKDNRRKENYIHIFQDIESKINKIYGLFNNLKDCNNRRLIMYINSNYIEKYKIERRKLYGNKLNNNFTINTRRNPSKLFDNFKNRKNKQNKEVCLKANNIIEEISKKRSKKNKNNYTIKNNEDIISLKEEQDSKSSEKCIDFTSNKYKNKSYKKRKNLNNNIKIIGKKRMFKIKDKNNKDKKEKNLIYQNGGRKKDFEKNIILKDEKHSHSSKKLSRKKMNIQERFKSYLNEIDNDEDFCEIFVEKRRKFNPKSEQKIKKNLK